jgi:hypothetical protein
MLLANVFKHFKHFPPCNLVIMNGNSYRPTEFCYARVLDSSYHRFRIMPDPCFYLIQFSDKDFALILAWT